MNRVVIVSQGGLIVGIFADRPHPDVFIVDWDEFTTCTIQPVRVPNPKLDGTIDAVVREWRRSGGEAEEFPAIADLCNRLEGTT